MPTNQEQYAYTFSRVNSKIKHGIADIQVKTIPPGFLRIGKHSLLNSSTG
jgi:hypothetical protein